jgi:DNA-nicking Smr family endonuclease
MARRVPPRHPAVDDWHLWTEVKRSVMPLRPERRLEDEPLPLPAAASEPSSRPEAKPVRTAPALPPYVPPPQRPHRPSARLEPRMRRRLRRGQIEIDATIDLHGMRQDEARAALGHFIATRAERGDRTVLVITGKGLRKTESFEIVDRGVLRSMLPIWLGEPGLRPLVAGWDPAAQGHGGEGAFYVRLRRAMRR